MPDDNFQTGHSEEPIKFQPDDVKNTLHRDIELIHSKSTSAYNR